MTAIIISRFDDLQNQVRSTDIHNAILIILIDGKYDYHGILKIRDNQCYLHGTRFGVGGPLSEWFSNISNDENILEFIKERWIYYSTGDNHYNVEIIIIRDPADIQSIVNTYKICNKSYINEIKSRFITEKSIIPSSRQTSESVGWVALEV